MHEIVATHIRYGYRRVHILLKREGWNLGRNVVYRLYREEGLVLRAKRPRRRKMAAHRQTRRQPSRVNEVWSMDFVHDQLSDGRKIRMLTMIDVYTREALAIEVGERLRGGDVALVLNRLVYLRGAPTALFVDNVLCRENLAVWVSRSWSIRLPGRPDTVAQTGSAVKK
jgi:putative transposase